jgi:two-component system KDP operon response regulator KdpE
MRVAATLEQGGYTIQNAGFRSDVTEAVLKLRPDIILLETPAADEGSLAFCQSLREAFATPIVICSTSGREWDIVRGLEAGADDYFVMPMRPVEFGARLRAVLRRIEGETKQPNADRMFAGPIEVRLDEHRAYRNGEPLDLSPIEFRLLTSLVRETGHAVTYAKLLIQAWGPEYADCRNYLRLYVRHLRSKIEDDPQHPTLIHNPWGVGYRLEAAAA